MAEERGEAGAGTLQTRRCAVVIDEAHSSQGRRDCDGLKEVLAARPSAKSAEEGRRGGSEKILRAFSQHGKRAGSDLSFFAFTATPKHKTLARVRRGGKPAHRYAMRQAIDEGFISTCSKSYRRTRVPSGC